MDNRLMGAKRYSGETGQDIEIKRGLNLQTLNVGEIPESGGPLQEKPNGYLLNIVVMGTSIQTGGINIRPSIVAFTLSIVA
ncbi:hypothetical protein OKW98_21680 [Pseudomonas sp. KU26590]|uniref:hypothetical protein n=1 Tax=Pseudomonas sp. KU26590 TaxID=2991051 RepID=UPI00223D18B9|nr:hypothetical protein [Pseudomonas sp. KU26590]UZJ59144.1 hypothetical protein OKW98_21680 [Pseudomonas sp. KU26590]